MRNLMTRAVAAFTLAVAPAAALALPYAVTFDTTTEIGSNVPAIVGGSGASITMVLDNGNASAASQTWAASTLQCVIFRFNGGSAYVAVNSPAANLDNTAGSFVTNASGVLTDVLQGWYETDSPIPPARVATNILSAPFTNWYVNGQNQVVSWDGQYINVNDVEDNLVAASWTNPQLATGLCASFAYGTASSLPTSIGIPVPAPTGLAIAALGAMLALMGAWVARKRRT